MKKDLIQRMLTVAVLMLCAATVLGQAAPTKPKPTTTQSSKPAAAPMQKPCNSVTDYDGNTYRTVQIGRQCWMAENLRTKHYSDGAYISSGNGTSETTAYWYYPDGNSGNASRYGLLYNWKAVMHNASSSNGNPSGVQGICPKGWHVPSDAEWTQLKSYVSKLSDCRCQGNSASIAKSLASSSGWNYVNKTCAVGNDQRKNNSTGFSAVPAGSFNGSDFGCYAEFWTTTYYVDNDWVYGWEIDCESTNFPHFGTARTNGYSVRCLRD